METRISHGWSTASERLAMALLPGCPPPAPTPLSHRRSVRTPFRQKVFRRHRPRHLSGDDMRVFSREERADREILVLEY
jgi:hypothetical protein